PQDLEESIPFPNLVVLVPDVDDRALFVHRVLRRKAAGPIPQRRQTNASAGRERPSPVADILSFRGNVVNRVAADQLVPGQTEFASELNPRVDIARAGQLRELALDDFTRPFAGPEFRMRGGRQFGAEIETAR